MKKNTLVKIYLANGMSAEGRVKKWKKNKVVLSSTTSSSKLTIRNPKQNIMMIQILEEPSERSFREPQATQLQPEAQEDLELDLPPITKEEEDSVSTEFPIDPKLRVKKLVELRLLKAQTERERAKKKLEETSFSPAPEKVLKEYYELPNFTTLRPKLSSPEEIS